MADRGKQFEGEPHLYIYVKTGPGGGLVISEEERNDLSFEPRFALKVTGEAKGCNCCATWGECEVEILKGNILEEN